MIWRLPLHALCHKEDAPPRPLDWLQMWDCFSADVECITFDRLQDARARVQLRDRSWAGAQYMFTLDWHGSPDAEEAGDGGRKCAHVFALDEGNFAAQPNNRVQWFCPAFITPFKDKPDFITNTACWKVERETETTQAHFYDDVAAGRTESQTRLYAKGATRVTRLLKLFGPSVCSRARPRPFMTTSTIPGLTHPVRVEVPAKIADELEVSFIMPCLNEAETLGRCIQAANRCITNNALAAEVLIADNGSTDGSQEIAQRNARASCRWPRWDTATPSSAASAPRGGASSSWATPTFPTTSPTP